MTVIVTHITVAQAATIINAFITFVSFTIALSLIILLVKFLPTTTTAIAWSSISRTLHSSVWPMVLGTDSRSGRTEGAVVSTITRLGTVTTILVAVAGIILPLGLSQGPVVNGDFHLLQGSYIADNSPLALSTTPNRGAFVYGRQCGFFELINCPGNDNPNTTAIAPSVVERFNSTPHGPFSMQFRRFYQGGEKVNCSIGVEASAEKLFLRNNTFFADGLLIDMTNESPGLGLWNQTLPTEAQAGGTWSQDILWIEPETVCVDTNLTVDYFLNDGPNLEIDGFNLTDHGGFYNLAHDPPPPLNRDGQNINLREHAYKGAAYSDLFAMFFFNATRNSSHEGSTYTIASNASTFTSLNSFSLTKITTLPLSYLNSTEQSTTEIICEGFGGGDTANITNVHVDCAIFLGPPLRSDGGDPRTFERGSKWVQGIHACSSATRASVQTVTFSSNSSSGIQDLQFTRDKQGLEVLWATENTNINISDIDLLWGRVDDRYEHDPSLSTVRSNRFYLPAGLVSVAGGLSFGMPAAAHAEIWASIYKSGFAPKALQDYSGKTDYAIRAKLQNLVAADPIRGNEYIRNLVFVDLLANNIIGSQANDTLMVADHLRTLSYDFKYAIPGFLLLAIWVPSFLLAAFFFLTRAVTLERIKQVLNHTSIGRTVVGTSALRAYPQAGGDSPPMPVPHTQYGYANMADASKGSGGPRHRRNKSSWADTVGKTPVTLNLNNSVSTSRNIMEENSKLMGTHSHYA